MGWNKVEVLRTMRRRRATKFRPFRVIEYAAVSTVSAGCGCMIATIANAARTKMPQEIGDAPR